MTDIFGQSFSEPTNFPQVAHSINNLTYVLWAKPVENGDLNKLTFLRSTNDGERFDDPINVISENADLFRLAPPQTDIKVGHHTLKTKKEKTQLYDIEV